MQVILSVKIFRHFYEDCFMYSVHLPLLVNKAQRIRVLCQNAMRCGTVVNAHQRLDTEEKKMLNNKVIVLVFYVHKIFGTFMTLLLNH